MGGLLRESIKRVEQGLNPSSLRTCLFLGQIGGWQSKETGLQIHLIPRYTAKGADSKEVIPIPPEVLAVADRLRKADSELIQEEKIEIPPKK